MDAGRGGGGIRDTPDTMHERSRRAWTRSLSETIESANKPIYHMSTASMTSIVAAVVPLTHPTRPTIAIRRWSRGLAKSPSPTQGMQTGAVVNTLSGNATSRSTSQGERSQTARNFRAALLRKAAVVLDDALPSKTFMAITGGRIIAAPNQSNQSSCCQSSIASHGRPVQIGTFPLSNSTDACGTKKWSV